MTPEERARAIVKRGGQILLPYDAGDAEVRFRSRRELVRLIEQAITEALEEERVGDMNDGLPS